MYEDSSTDCVLLVDASNAFDSLNRATAVHNIGIPCPELHLYLKNIYTSPSKMFINGTNQHILPAEGVTQGCNLAMGFYVTAEGYRYLGSFIGTKAATELYVKEKVNDWVVDMNDISTAAACEPQLAFASYYYGISKMWNYLMRTTPDIAPLLSPIEKSIKQQLIPSPTGINPTPTLFLKRSSEEDTDEEIFNKAHAVFSSPEQANSQMLEDLQDKAFSAIKAIPTNSTPASSLNPISICNGSFEMSPIKFDSSHLNDKKADKDIFNVPGDIQRRSRKLANDKTLSFHNSTLMTDPKICHKTGTEVRVLENEIEDVNSLKISQEPETIEAFDTQIPIYIEPEIIADLMKSDDSIYDQLSDDENKNINNQLQSTATVQGVKESISNETSIINSSKISPEDKADSQNSNSDLFMETVAPYPVNENSNEWPKVCDMSSQEISKHFEFRLSESDDCSSNKSCDSDDLFP
ncbi:hypothetical protein ACHWQZ_G006670 [Mnemiopsis leidyi]